MRGFDWVRGGAIALVPGVCAALALGGCAAPVPAAPDGAGTAGPSTTIALADGATTVDGAGARADGDVVTISQGGSYRLSGSLSDGSVVVDADGQDVSVVFDGVSLASSGPCAFDVVAAGEVVVEVADGTQNRVSDAGDAPADGADACLYSETDLVLCGTGTLEVQAGAKDAVTSKGSLSVTGVHLVVSAPDHGIEGKGSLTVDQGAEVEVEAGEGDGLRSDGDLVLADATTTVSAGDDGVHTEGALSVTAGTHTVTSCTEGLEGSSVTVSGGEVSVSSTDDAINAAGDTGPFEVRVSGGTVSLTAAGDAIDSNGTLELSGGTVVAACTGQADGALDFEESCVVSGGTLVAVGGGMAAWPTEATQPVAVVGFGATVPAGSAVVLADSDGAEMARFEVPQASTYAVVSSPELQAGPCTVTWEGGSCEAELTEGVTTVGQTVPGAPGGRDPGAAGEPGAASGLAPEPPSAGDSPGGGATEPPGGFGAPGQGGPAAAR
ncbi:carbohydrate-binding domain-containing protein [Caniella muris]|uniref:carbohydrate-binding domain-containing protein n=1 Tax=Caniella muris TaxID=2941502 RepID=UPI00203D97DC|nr:carbohydrate-binding domain-containing protein [Caniella muris]